MKSRSYWIEGDEYGSAYFFDEQGNLTTYQCKDFLGDVIYLLKVSEDGFRITEEGAVFSYNFKMFPIDTSELKTNIPVVLKITVSELPNYSTHIRVQIIDHNGVSSTENHSIENSTILMKKKFEQPGQHGIKVIGEIRDENNISMLQDSVVFTLNVKP